MIRITTPYGRWVCGLIGMLALGGLEGAAAEPEPAAVSAGARAASLPAVFQLRSERVRESSGVVASRRHPGVFWTHADSSGASRIFSFTGDGEVLAEVILFGARNVDWEDIAADDAGRLYIADSGNNANRRRDLAVYVVPEPDPRGGTPVVRVERVIRFRYPDQRAFPEPERLDFDAEALFWDDGLYLLTKHRSDARTTLYRFPAAGEDAAEQVLERVAEIDLGVPSLLFGGMVTGADLHRDGRTLAVLTYWEILLFRRRAGVGHALAERVRRIPLGQPAAGTVEGIAWAGDDLLVLSEEGRGVLIPDAIARDREGAD